MHLAQGGLFWGMDIDFVRSVTDIGETISYKEGDAVFNTGDPADNFYVLLRGSVVMERGKGQWHTADHPGELFGWSALISREAFSASAICKMDTELLKIAREPFLELLERSPECKAQLFEHFAKMLGNQLLEVYISANC